MRIEFTKMEGLGNDYIYVDASRFSIPDPAAAAVRLSDRHFGIGADGLVLIGESPRADFSMRMFNADGSEGLMCGNAARCIGKYVSDKGLWQGMELTLDTLSGVKHLWLHPGPDGLVESVSVDMGEYRIVERALTLQAAGESFTGAVVNVGNPHFVVFCADADALDLPRIGPAIETHPLFPGRINVEFVSVRPAGSPVQFSCEAAHPQTGSSPALSACEAAHPQTGSSPVLSFCEARLRMRVWERGSGITLACGTGACATAAAWCETQGAGQCESQGAARATAQPSSSPAGESGQTSSPVAESGQTSSPVGTVEIEMDGGVLQVSCNTATRTILMTGPARTVFEGTAEV